MVGLGTVLAATASPRRKVTMMARHIPFIAALVCYGLALSGCGDSPGDRAASGGLIGAGAGAAISGLAGGSLATGALLGGAAGAIGGAVTSPDDIDLGRPVWR